jgi:hypothetical protein
MTVAHDISPKWVLLPKAAATFGFKNALSCKRWCRAHGVELLFDGAKLWVHPPDIDAALEAMKAPPKPPQPSNDDNVRSGVQSMKGRR